MGVLIVGNDGTMLKFKQRYLIAACSDGEVCKARRRVDDLDQPNCVTKCWSCGSFAVFIECCDYEVVKPTAPRLAEPVLPVQRQPVPRERWLRAVA